MSTWRINYYDVGDVPAWHHVPTEVPVDDLDLKHVVERERHRVTMDMGTSAVISVSLAFSGAAFTYSTPGERRIGRLVCLPLSVLTACHAVALSLVHNAPPNMCRRVRLPWRDLVVCGPVLIRRRDCTWYDVRRPAYYELRSRVSD